MKKLPNGVLGDRNFSFVELVKFIAKKNFDLSLFFVNVMAFSVV